MGMDSEAERVVFSSRIEVVGGREGRDREMGGLRIEMRWIVYVLREVVFVVLLPGVLGRGWGILGRMY